MQTVTFEIDTTSDNFQSIAEAVEDFFVNSKSKKHWGDYYFQYEKGEKTGKLHLQGWVDSDYSKSTIDSSTSNPFRDFIKPLTTHYTMIHARKENYKSYIANNATKGYVEYRWTNIDDETLRSLPVFEERTKWLEKKASKKTDWFNDVFVELEEYAVSKNLKGVHVINYQVIPSFVYARIPKKLSYNIYTELLDGLTKSLENKYPAPQNKKLYKTYLDKLKNDEFRSSVYFN